MACTSNQQVEVEKRERRLDALQERVTELKELAKLQETPIQLQVSAKGWWCTDPSRLNHHYCYYYYYY